MTHQLAMCHLTDGMDEVVMVKIFEPILVQIVGIGATVEVMSRGVFNTVLITSILQSLRTCETMKARDLLGTPLH